MAARIQIDYRRVERLFTETRHEAAERAARFARSEVRRNILLQDRVRSGEMLESVKVVKRGPTDFRVESDTGHTMFQEKGIGPVVPVKAKALRFMPKGSGTFVFAARTKGFEGGRFFERASRSIRLRHFLP